ncbi:MAG: polysaccharide biosynthesis protein, partial [Gammaproteobacteria bacterium]|nr:polysaccharide biosynthesis protein [Gammaproteobacteria bacterium]
SDAHINFQTLPSISELAAGDVTLKSLREVDVEDLLGREQVAINWQEVQNVITGKVILISGGGGSIGSEICRQVARLKPQALVVLERAEFNLYQLQQEITANFPELNFITYLGSVADKLLVKNILHETKPDMIFHAAAYKHVPILETQIYSAITNNVIGTKTLAEAAVAAGIKKFVMVSTDKAVHPTNIMGATKRLAEMICQSYSNDKTQFITVRFGNVLGSSGSVVPLFKKQLAAGGPITVTHPEITRYFMTIPEAVCLILQTCVLGKGGEIFVLDMGEPVKIAYLAEQIIRLSGKQPGVDVKIVYTGLRPGEKMHEELFYQNEEMVYTQHKKVFRAISNGVAHDFNSHLHTLEKALTKDDSAELDHLLKQLVPEFHPVTHLD